ncbi:MAG: outer membrane beta-barrel protein, partial [Capnocytophaga sp.]|nr:outer membrane beta-barrel protein [Capnocytophaga sp.]
NDISVAEYPNFALKRLSFSINSQHELQLPFQIKGNINTDFYSKRINAANEIANTSGFIDLGLQRSFWNEKLNVAFSFTDILHTNRWDNESHLPNLSNYGWGNYESRQIKFYLTYKIGKQKAQTAHQSDLDETERL